MLKFIQDYSEILAILFSPLIAWIVTIWYQNRAEKLKAKRDLFMVLMAKRHTMPPPIEFVDALNKIDVVFQNNMKVRLAWKEYLDCLHENNPLRTNANSFLLDLLSEIANDLGYKNLKQTEIDRFYNPVYLRDQTNNQNAFWTEYIRILYASKNLAEGYTKKELKKIDKDIEKANRQIK